MTDNPYESPQELGYISPARAALHRYLKDRLALLACALLVFGLVMAISLWSAMRHNEQKRPRRPPPRPARGQGATSARLPASGDRLRQGHHGTQRNRGGTS